MVKRKRKPDDDTLAEVVSKFAKSKEGQMLGRAVKQGLIVSTKFGLQVSKKALGRGKVLTQRAMQEAKKREKQDRGLRGSLRRTQKRISAIQKKRRVKKLSTLDLKTLERLEKQESRTLARVGQKSPLNLDSLEDFDRDLSKQRSKLSKVV